MTTVPLGQDAYKRQFARETEIKLINRFLEKAPTNLREHVALLARPGTELYRQYTPGPGRSTYSLDGMFDDSFFVFSGDSMWRTALNGTTVQVVGKIYGTQKVYATWMKGLGYEYMFVADGLLFRYYDGGTHATGTLTKTGSVGSQVVNIGTAYYGWDADPNTGTPDGTSTNPWLALLGGTDAESLENLANLIMFAGVPGVDFSDTLPGPSAEYTATSDATHLFITSISPYADGNALATTIFSGVNLSWGAATLTGGNVHELKDIAVPDGAAIKALCNVSSFVLASVGNSQKVYFIEPGAVSIDPLNFFEKESNPDNVEDMLNVGDQALIMGNGSTENWYATGNSDLPFAPVQGRVYARGVVPGSAAVVNDSLILIGNDLKVYEVGLTSGGGQWGVRRISTNGIEERIRTQIRREQSLP